MSYLSALCYNFGIDCYQKKLYEMSTNWLRDSFEMGKGKHGVGQQVQVSQITAHWS